MNLFKAEKIGNEEELQELVQECKEVNGQNSYPNSLHEMSTSHNSDPTAQALTRGDADINLQDQEGDTALHIAAIHGDTESVKALIQSGADPDIKNRWGDTPLYIAALNGHLGSIVALVHAGADPDIQNCWGNTPLYIAALNNHPASIEALAQAGANANIQNKDGWTALHCASSKSENMSKIECVKALLDAGADYTLMNNAFQTPEDLVGNETIKIQFRDHRITHENQKPIQTTNEGEIQKSASSVTISPTGNSARIWETGSRQPDEE
jgi:ankyrin repeat protein